MKEKVRVKCYLRYCDDCSGMAKTKAEAWAHLNEFYRQSSKYGFVMKADAIVAPIASRRRADGKKKRKRQRGGRKVHRLSRIQLLPEQCADEEKHEAELCKKSEIH